MSGYNPNETMLPASNGPIVAMSGGGGSLAIPSNGGGVAEQHPNGGGLVFANGGGPRADELEQQRSLKKLLQAKKALKKVKAINPSASKTKSAFKTVKAINLPTSGKKEVTFANNSPSSSVSAVQQSASEALTSAKNLLGRTSESVSPPPTLVTLSTSSDKPPKDPISSTNPSTASSSGNIPDCRDINDVLKILMENRSIKLNDTYTEQDKDTLYKNLTPLLIAYPTRFEITVTRV